MANNPRRDFYWQVMDAVRESGVPFMVGGAYAMAFYTGITRKTKDLDIFTHPRDTQRLMEFLSKQEFSAQVIAPQWLANVISEEGLVDVIFGSRNGIAIVDDEWFAHASEGELFDSPVKFVPVGETIWSKGFVMERDRYDGADIAHLLHSKGKEMDWHRLLTRFGDNWQLFFSHLVMFTFVYPSEQHLVPDWVTQELVARWTQKKHTNGRSTPICRGTLLSHAGYTHDIEEWGYLDARLAPIGKLTPEQIK